MSWTPAYQAQFAKPLVNQLIAIIQRDQAAALAVVNAARATDGNPALNPIAEFRKGPRAHVVLPSLFVAIGPDEFDSAADPSVRKQTVRIRLDLDTGQYDQEMAQENSWDYARMLDMVISSAEIFDAAGWEAPLPIQHDTVPSGITVPNAFGTVKNVFIESQVPGLAALEEYEGPIMRISLTVLFELQET